jgi:predicted dienelactone hydrolase
MEVWYPAQVEPPDTATDSRPPAARGRPLESSGAPYPLVAFSHGSSGIRYQSPFLTEYLASHGFVVVSPDHTRNTFLDNDPGAMVDVLVERPDDLRFSVDHLMGLSDTAGNFWTGWVGDGSYGVVGHSFGAFTALVLGGGRWSPEGVEPWCEAHAADSQACDLIGSLPEDVLDGHGGPDDRVAVTVAMAPGVWYGFGVDGEGLAEVRRPLLLGSDADQILPYEAETRPTYERLSPPRALLTFEDAAHFAPYSNLCEFFPGFSSECAGPPEWVDPQWAQVQTRILVTAWLREGLSPGAHAGDLSLLDPSAWDHPGVQLER